ncbi:hypothetical protein N9N06_04125 [Aquiluna sp.]|nr:hypothetical protein [Aquiluna sp.]
MSVAAKLVLISLEHKEREFQAKVLLAQELASRGYKVLLGPTEVIDKVALLVKGAIYLHKSQHPNAVKFIRRGNFFCILDEEGGITTPRSTLREFCRSRYSNASSENTTLILLPGLPYLRELEKLPQLIGVEKRVTGWPRVDLWQSEFRGVHGLATSEIMQKHGDFYLLISSFGGGSEARIQRIIQEASSDAWKKILLHRLAGFRMYVAMIEDLCRSYLGENETLIVRPHPSEPIHEWKDTLDGIPKVKVLRDGDLTPWILASKGTIHFGSTAVTQSVVLGKSVVQYRVKESKGITDTPSFELPVNARTTKEIYSSLSAEAGTLTRQLRLAESRMARELDFRSGMFAYKKVADALDDLNGPFEVEELTTLQKVRVKLFSNALWAASFLKSQLRGSGFLKTHLKTVYENLPGGIRVAEARSLILQIEDQLEVKREHRVSNFARNVILIERELAD